MELWTAIPIGIGILGAAISIKAFLSNTTISRDQAKLNERLIAAETSLIRVTADITKAANDVAMLHTQVTSAAGTQSAVALRHADYAVERGRREVDFENRLRELEHDSTIDKLAQQVTELSGRLETQVALLNGNIEAMRTVMLKDQAHIESVVENTVLKTLNAARK